MGGGQEDPEEEAEDDEEEESKRNDYDFRDFIDDKPLTVNQKRELEGLIQSGQVPK